MKLKSDLHRQNILVQLIKKYQNKKKTTMKFLKQELNNFIEGNGDDPVSQRTLERDIKQLRDAGVQIVHSIINGNYVYYIEGDSEFAGEYLSEEEEKTLPFLLELIQSQHEFESITWLKSNLNKLGIDISDAPHKHFIMHQPEMRNIEKILRLSSQLLEHIKSEEAVQFYYDPVNSNKNKKLHVIAPLQIRYYDSRYYLIGCYIGSKGPYESLTVYALDRIEQQEVTMAIDEEKFEVLLKESHDDVEAPPIKFNYKQLASKTRLKNYFDHSIGLVVPSNQSPVYIYFKIRDWVVSYLKNRPLHKSQTTLQFNSHQIELQANEILIRIYVYDTVEVEFATARFRNDCVRMELKKNDYEKYVKPNDDKKLK